MNIYSALLMSEQQIYNRFRAELTGLQTYKKDKYLYIDNGHKCCLVAHVDTVKRNKVVLHDERGVITNKHGVLGADDRAGIYGVYKIAKATGCNVLITSGEETGGIGAKQASLDIEFNGVNLLIELDRAGSNDFVYYSYALPKQIDKFCRSFGFVEEWGSYSDIAEIAHIPSVNISIGYFKQHTAKEYLVTAIMEANISRVQDMVNNCPDKRYPMPEDTFTSPYSWDWDRAPAKWRKDGRR